MCVHVLICETVYMYLCVCDFVSNNLHIFYWTVDLDAFFSSSSSSFLNGVVAVSHTFIVAICTRQTMVFNNNVTRSCDAYSSSLWKQYQIHCNWAKADRNCNYNNSKTILRNIKTENLKIVCVFYALYFALLFSITWIICHKALV